jgi:DNA-binding transcriptional ArsR family regulator
MARAAATADVFNAIAEPKRRRIVDELAGGEELAVGQLVERLRIPQPDVSKHLGVLRKVGVVDVTRHGSYRYYRLNAHALKPVHDWVKTYERFWNRQLDRIKQRAEKSAREREATQG